jgi:hypothetical protein
MRVAWIELRRSNALAVAVLLVAVSLAALATNLGYWNTQWTRFANDQASAVFVLFPITLAGGAMLGRRERRTRADELFGSTARPRWQRLAPAGAAMAVAVVAAHLLVFAAGGVLVARSAGYTSPRLALYLRSRRWPAALTTSVAAMAATWAAWSAATDRREVSPSLTVLTVALALAPMIPTLSGDDDALESTAALPWPPRRALHLLACFAVVAAVLGGTRATGAWFGPTWPVIRDCAGLTGLIGLCVALVGTQLAWAPPIAWTAVQVLFGAPAGNGVLFWLIQPPGSSAATLTAAALFLAGLLAYALRPGPPA